ALSSACVILRLSSFRGNGGPRDLHAFPTRRSSDLRRRTMQTRAEHDDALEAETRSLVSGAPLGRRGFVVGSLASGFAAAVAPAGPLLAQTITTDASGLSAGEVKIPVSGGEIPAYRAMPAGRTGLPTILVVQEIFGVHEHIRDVCRRFAKQGHLAVAVELFARQGDPGQYT